MSAFMRVAPFALIFALAACGDGKDATGSDKGATVPSSTVPSGDAEIAPAPSRAASVEVVRVRPALMGAARMLSDMPADQRARVVDQIKCMGREAVAEGRTPAPRTSAVIRQAEARVRDAVKASACREMLAKPTMQPGAATQNDATVPEAIHNN